ncbi:MerR family transcriptional regulator [candidate division KSB1 bacterium]
MSPKPVKKLYYSISEISEMIGLKQYVLRYWETEFPELKPQKNRAGNRIYKEKDIKLINRIMELLYNHKYTIEGAKQKLKEEHKRSDDGQINLEFDAEKRKKAIEEIRDEIKNLIDIL